MKLAIIISTLTTALCYLAWPPMHFTFLLVVIWVPLLVYRHKMSFANWVLSVALSLLGFNTATTYWLYYTLPISAFLIHLFNSLIFSVPFILLKIAGRRINTYLAYTIFITSWITLEFLHLTLEVGYPFLNLGNGLAMVPQSFQWYEFTGVLGGSLWLLLLNTLIAEICLSWPRGSLVTLSSITAFSICLPLLVSIYIYHSFEDNEQYSTVLVISPAIDCYTEKYQKDNFWLVKKYTEIIKSSPKTEFIILPETAFPNMGLVNNLNRNPIVDQVKKDLEGLGTYRIISGAILYATHGKNPSDKTDLTFYQPLDEFVSTHNSAIEISSDTTALLRSKQKLVPFEESAPYPRLLGGIRSLFGTLGGFTFSPLIAGKGNSANGMISISPIICFEVLFGNETAKLSRTCDAFAVILNEGWYHNRTGSNQFLYYTSLRAVETRRSFARSSNVGFSAIIDQTGTIIRRTDNIWEPNALLGTLNRANYDTTYSLYGDYVGLLSICLLVVLIMYVVAKTVSAGRLPKKQ